MSRKSTIDSLFSLRGEPVAPPVAGDRDRVRTGAISAMGHSLKELAETARAAEQLQGRIHSGAAVIEIQPEALDDSLVSDRLISDVDPSFEALVESMRGSGQQVPILVRPHPDDPDRYQIAYGHRRARAARRLGIRVKAIARALSDAELVVAQGKENLDRRDLSYIEKALFARRLEDRGFDRATIMAALSADKADLSRYIAVARSVPEDIAAAIGPAGKVGRARWLALAERLAEGGASRIVAAAIAGEAFKALDSDGRFAMLFAALEPKTSGRAAKPSIWRNAAGRKAGWVQHRAGQTVLTIDEKSAPRFGAYLATHLNEFYSQFLKSEAEEATD